MAIQMATWRIGTGAVYGRVVPLAPSISLRSGTDSGTAAKKMYEGVAPRDERTCAAPSCVAATEDADGVAGIRGGRGGDS
jgi:hypothetical protein